MAILQGETGFFIRETKFLGLGPHGGNFGGRAAGAHEFDRSIKIFAAALVGVVHGMRGIADCETTVVAGAISHVGMKNVVIDGIAGTKDAIGEDVGMGVTALAGDGVDGLDVFGAKIVQNLADQANGLVFAHSGLHGAIELVIGGINHHGGSVEECDFVARFDEAGFRHKGLAVDDGDALFLQGEENGEFDNVDADGILVEAAHFELDANLLSDIFGAAHLRRHGATQHGNAGAGALAEPRTMQLMMPGGRAEVPEDGLVVLR